jgi:hypothetical protein
MSAGTQDFSKRLTQALQLGAAGACGREGAVCVVAIREHADAARRGAGLGSLAARFVMAPGRQRRARVRDVPGRRRGRARQVRRTYNHLGAAVLLSSVALCRLNKA